MRSRVLLLCLVVCWVALTSAAVVKFGTVEKMSKGSDAWDYMLLVVEYVVTWCGRYPKSPC
jgi:hypothetical protein